MSIAGVAYDAARAGAEHDRKRIAELETALRSVLDTHRDRYACASEWNDCFDRARKILEKTT
jgi:hypothetical protein